MSKAPKSALPTTVKRIQPSGQTDASFFEQVHAIARCIPYGKVTSYGAIAAALGSKSGARMVGWAMNLAHTVNPPVPAHRVVNRAGMLSGKNHFGSPTQMQKLLEAEGVEVVNDQVKNLDAHFWDPANLDA